MTECNYIISIIKEQGITKGKIYRTLIPFDGEDIVAVIIDDNDDRHELLLENECVPFHRPKSFIYDDLIPSLEDVAGDAEIMIKSYNLDELNALLYGLIRHYYNLG